ncbi:MAG: response regulator [Kastovskya adunca ATA6-11-RM4]|jgi:CheY-like chemotaxis protein|nr:response regulator [Kastovskya adunca ATA6-11-RM4]
MGYLEDSFYDLRQSIVGSGIQLSQSSRPLVLAVDDDEDNLLLMAYALEQPNCTLLAAKDGKSALSLAQTYQPNLILLDILLPDLSGIEVVSQLRQDPRTAKIPVIAVTAFAKPEDRERLIVAGCNDYICKPYLLEDLEALIQPYLSSALIIS